MLVCIGQMLSIKGDADGAARVLESGRDQLRDMARQSSAPDRLEGEALELDRRASELREQGDMNDSRKFMVAECMNISRSDYVRAQTSRVRRSRKSPSGNTGGKA